MKSTKEFLFTSSKEIVLSEKLLSARKRGKFCDVELASCDKAVTAHRVVLASFSPHLENLFSDVELQNSINFQKYSYDALEGVIDYVYTGCLRVGSTSISEVTLLSAELHLDELHSACLAELTKELEKKPFVIRAFAEKNDFHQLLVDSDNFIRHNFAGIHQTKQFLQLPRLQVELFTNRQHANLVKANDEEVLMVKVVEWVRRRLQVHGEKLQSLLEESRMVYLQSDDSLRDMMLEEGNEAIDLNFNEKQEVFNRMISRESTEIYIDHESLKTISMCKLIACTHTSEQSYVGVALLDGRIVAINLHHKSNKSRSSRSSFSSDSSSSEEGNAVLNTSVIILAPMALGKCSMGVASIDDKVYVIGGYNRGNCISAVECYDADVNAWQPGAALPLARSRLSAVAMGGKLYALGGSDGFSILNTVDVFEPLSGKWSCSVPMSDRRCNFGATVLNDRIYAIGGSLDSTAMKSCEMYSGSLGKWVRVASLHLPRENVCVVQCNGIVYAIGGSHGWSCHNSVESYNPEDNSWNFVASMHSPRRGAAAAVCDGKIMVAGGSDGRSALKTVEQYDPSTNTWQVMSDMLTPRNNPGLAVIHNELYVFGGFGGASGTEFLNTVEYFDKKINDWKIHL